MHFEKIWTENYQHLKNFISQKVPQQDVEDILQTISISLYNRVQSSKEIRNPQSWLFQVSRNKIADYYQAKSKSTQSALNYVNTAATDFEPCVCDIVEQVIKGVLPPKYSTPLILSDIHKIPQKEIALQMNLSYENVKSRILRARKKMKEKVLESVKIELNNRGEIVSGKLKDGNHFPLELVTMIKKMDLEI